MGGFYDKNHLQILLPYLISGTRCPEVSCCGWFFAMKTTIRVGMKKHMAQLKLRPQKIF